MYLRQCRATKSKKDHVSLLERLLPDGREDIPWSMTAMTLVLMRLCESSSELRIAEHLYERSSLTDLLGIPPDRVNDDRLYRALDNLLPHKAEMEKHLKRCIAQPTTAQAILLQRLQLHLPEHMKIHEM
ncbi:MAG: hypothetical protein HYX87_04775 [Chloroflexi bacterium]|nr:hypothetical protein [Chloroflexota bacterium]